MNELLKKSATEQSKALKNKEISAVELTNAAFERINNSAIEELVMLNTIPLPEKEGLDKFKSISVAPLFAEAIKRIYDDEPISKLFEN